MFRPSYGKCVKCGNNRLIVVVRGLCRSCNELGKRKNNEAKKQGNAEGGKGKVVSSFCRSFNRKANAPNNARALSFTKKPRTSRKQPKATGELELFKRLYEERGPHSEVAPFEFVAFDVRCFSHLLSKQSYPSLRLEPENIVIKTPKQHDMWHTQYHKLKHLPEWQWVLEKEQALKQKYYLENKIKKL